MPKGKTTPENTWQRIEYWIKRNPDKTVEECQELLDEKLRHNREAKPSRIEFWQKKYPEKSLEECQELLKEHKEKVKKTHTPENTSTCIEYWLSKGYSEEEAKELLRNRQSTFTLEKCINKYGKEEGEKIFNNRQKRWINSLKKNFERYGDGRSVQSELAYTIIEKICNSLNINRPLREKWMFDSEKNRAYAYDFQYRNKIVEINGDYWHANPKIYNEDFYNKSKQMTAEEIWLYDKLKYKHAESKGYSVYVIWESDWNKDPQNELNKCMEFLNA